VPKLWRYLLVHYVKVLLICLVGFIAILLTTRFVEIARFAASGVGFKILLHYISHQIQYILPIAIPISCLISSLVLFQQLSHNSELTALRASGLALRQIIGPILLAGAFISIGNFYIVSELSTESHLATRQLENSIKSLNPLSLLQNASFLRLRGIYVDILGPSRPGEMASEVILALKNSKHERIHLLLAKEISTADNHIGGEDISIITGSGDSAPEEFDHLVIENIKSMTTPIPQLSQLFKQDGWRLTISHLRMPLLLARLRELRTTYAEGVLNNASEASLKPYIRYINDCLSEISKRFSVAIATFVFTFMGCSFGTSISRRQQSIRGIVYVIFLSGLYLICFFTAKSVDHQFYLASSLHFIPLILATVLSAWNLNRVTRGIE
jgi:lipopolysaccharide export system permease protein